MPGLGVNIDHVATLREARKTVEPDPLWACAEAELGGADCITFHLRKGMKWSDGAPFTTEDFRFFAGEMKRQRNAPDHWYADVPLTEVRKVIRRVRAAKPISRWRP